ncbi:MAG: DUF2127 domain-containing protein [Patescibacteria group bacterium]|nr:DUF2127 domain-containing protein [Patescibacteria group bacterium]
MDAKHTRIYFLVSVFAKGVVSVVEVTVGIVVFFVPLSFFTGLLLQFAQSDFIEDSGDFIAGHLMQLAVQSSFASNTFVAIYLLSRGIVKLGLVVALLKNWLWAYPLSLIVLGLFVLYQLYQIATTHSLLILALTLFDLVVMYFIWREYQIVRGLRAELR